MNKIVFICIVGIVLGCGLLVEADNKNYVLGNSKFDDYNTGLGAGYDQQYYGGTGLGHNVAADHHNYGGYGGHPSGKLYDNGYGAGSGHGYGSEHGQYQYAGQNTGLGSTHNNNNNFDYYPANTNGYYATGQPHQQHHYGGSGKQHHGKGSGQVMAILKGAGRTVLASNPELQRKFNQVANNPTVRRQVDKLRPKLDGVARMAKPYLHESSRLVQGKLAETVNKQNLRQGYQATGQTYNTALPHY